jgi:hypothetical protein
VTKLAIWGGVVNGRRGFAPALWRADCWHDRFRRQAEFLVIDKGIKPCKAEKIKAYNDSGFAQNKNSLWGYVLLKPEVLQYLVGVLYRTHWLLPNRENNLCCQKTQI